MEETTVRSGEVVGFSNSSANVTNSIKGATVKKTIDTQAEESIVSKVVDIGSKMSTDKVSIVKKDGTLEAYDITKVVTAIKKSAARMLIELTDEEINQICSLVNKSVLSLGNNKVELIKIHSIVESALEDVNPKVAKSYRDYRNYKIDFVKQLYDACNTFSDLKIKSFQTTPQSFGQLPSQGAKISSL
jgi:transcriptional regulator NrdR family protein